MTAPVIDNSAKDFADGSWGSGTSFTFSYAITSGTNGYLRVSTFLSGVSTNDVTGITFNGNAMGNLGFKATTSPDTLSVWGLKGQSGTHNVVVSVSPFNGGVQIEVDSWTGVDQTTPNGTTVTNSGNSNAPTATATLPSGGIVVGSVIDHYAYSVATAGQTLIQRSGNIAAQKGQILMTSSSAATGTLTYSIGPSGYPWAEVVTPLNAAAPGIAFDAAANSGDVAAANTYSGSASWNGTNRLLAVDVSLLGAGVSVTSMTYGGAACTLIGTRSTVTSLGAIECWRIKSTDSGAPGTGANTLVVNLSGSIEFTVEWVSYTGVNQTEPVEAFNSAQATNVGAADATVTITTISDNCWVHGAVVASDTTITANQTTRNNISGTLGSGANEDNNAAKTPAGAVTMSYTNVGAAVTWAIAGYAIRPLADFSPAMRKTLSGIGTRIGVRQLQGWN